MMFTNFYLSVFNNVYIYDRYPSSESKYKVSLNSDDE